MAKGKLVVFVFIIVVAVGTLFFYMGKRNKPDKDLSANKTEAAVSAEEGEKVAKEDSAANMKPEPIIGKKEIRSSSKSQGSKEGQSGSLAELSEHEAKQREYELNREFEEEAKEILPLLSIQTNNPLDAKAFGPRRGEIWVRVKPDNARELKQIMEELAELYRTHTGYEGGITIMHWVGGRPHFKMRFPASGENE